MILLKSKSLIPFIMVGYPTLEASFEFAKILIEEGVSALELGVPFSDPLADGPVIQQAAQVALENKVYLEQVLEFVSQLRTLDSKIPLVLFTYFNPIYCYGIERYVKDALQAGATATLTVDLPPEEATDYVCRHKEAGLKTIFLASPTTTTERLRKINAMTTGFVYYISRKGVTGEAQEISATLSEELIKVRQFVKQPIAVGFGISTPEQIKVVAQMSDAVVIGSRYLRLMQEGKEAVRDFTKTTLQILQKSTTGATK